MTSNQAPYSGNRLADPNFDTSAYFGMSKHITTMVKASKIPFERVYSEPRKSTGYRTKFWSIKTKYKSRIEAICETLYPGIFKVTGLERHAGSEWSDSAIIITLKDKSQFMLNS